MFAVAVVDGLGGYAAPGISAAGKGGCSAGGGMLHEPRAEDAHVAGQHHQIGLVLVDGVRQRGERRAIGISLASGGRRCHGGRCPCLRFCWHRHDPARCGPAGRRQSAGDCSRPETNTTTSSVDDHLLFVGRGGQFTDFPRFSPARSAARWPPLRLPAGDDHAYAAVEGAVHFMTADVAGLLQPVNTAGHCQLASSITACMPSGSTRGMFSPSRRR